MEKNRFSVGLVGIVSLHLFFLIPSGSHNMWSPVGYVYSFGFLHAVSNTMVTLHTGIASYMLYIIRLGKE